MDLSQTDNMLLEEIQKDFPLISRPFQEIGSRCGLTEDEAIKSIKNFLEIGIIREISAVFDSKRLGFRSTLVALKVNKNAIELVAKKLNSHKGVSHNYLRQHEYNIWFTLTLHKNRDLKVEVNNLIHEFGNKIKSILILPSTKTFKIGVHFKLGSEEKKPAMDINAVKTLAENREQQQCEKTEPSDFDLSIIKILEKELEIIQEPFKVFFNQLGIQESEFFHAVKSLKEKGVIKRISGVLRHREIGYHANGMACFTVPENMLNDAGKKAAQYENVSHCYLRTPLAGDWKYPLFAMVHARTREECEKVVNSIAQDIVCTDFKILYSTREFKKQRVKYGALITGLFLTI